MSSSITLKFCHTHHEPPVRQNFFYSIKIVVFQSLFSQTQMTHAIEAKHDAPWTQTNPAWTVSLHDEAFADKVGAIVAEYGLAVVTHVLPDDECDAHVDSLVTYIERLGTGVDRHDIRGTWTPDRLPPQTRPGLFQCLLANTPAAWTIRAHPHVRRIFQTLYSRLRGGPVDEFIVSNDGINLRANGLDGQRPSKRATKGGQPSATDTTDTADWAHLDQTSRDNVFLCLQGQAVLANTTAAFRASPKSVHAYRAILDACHVAPDNDSNWLKFAAGDYDMLRRLVEAVPGGAWQVPIRAPKGSFIVWTSSTVHSALRAERIEPAVPTDVWRGYRAVIYVCYR